MVVIEYSASTVVTCRLVFFHCQCVIAPYCSVNVSYYWCGSVQLSKPDGVLCDHFSLSLSLSLPQLLEKQQNQRLGYGPDGFTNIREHPFFATINWTHLEKGVVEPPFKPNVSSLSLPLSLSLSLSLSPLSQSLTHVLTHTPYTIFVHVSV